MEKLREQLVSTVISIVIENLRESEQVGIFHSHIILIDLSFLII